MPEGTDSAPITESTDSIMAQILAHGPLMPRLSVEELAQELRVRKRAQDAGRVDEPKSGETSIDQAQQEILNTVRERLSEARGSMTGALESLQQRRKQISLDPIRQALRDAQHTTHINIERVKAAHRDALIGARTEERLHLRNLRHFRKKNDIHHEARYPESKLLHWAILAAMLFGESILNSYFFSLASDLGLLGGAFQALLISGVNIGLAIFAGEFGLRQVNHIDASRKALGALVLAIYFALTSAFNLATAHYRALLEIDPLSALELVLSRLTRTPFGFDNFDAVILLLIGMMFSLAALYKTYAADDSYPGYGAMDRAYKEARTHYEACKTALGNEINSTIDEGRRHVGQLMTEARAFASEFPTNLHHAKSLRADFAAYAQQAETTLRQLLELYRAENADVRTSRPPAYFKEFPTTGIDHELPDTGVAADAESFERFKDVLADTEQESDDVMARFKEINDAAIDEAKSFIKEIESEADERIAQADSLEELQALPRKPAAKG